MGNTAIKERGETPFPEAGDGVVFRFRNADLKRIEAAEGDAFFNKLAEKIMVGNMSFGMLELYLKEGLKGPDGQPFTVAEDLLDKVPVHDVWEKIFDAVTRSMRGMGSEEYLIQLTNALADANGGDEPPLTARPETGSTNNAERLSGPE